MNKEPIATIEFSFLKEQENVKGWDNTFYQLFSIFDHSEYKFIAPRIKLNDHLILIVRENSYIKVFKEKKIQVYLNCITQYKEGNQLYLFLLYDGKEKDLMNQLINEMEHYLRVKKKRYAIRSDLELNEGVPSDVKLYKILEVFRDF